MLDNASKTGVKGQTNSRANLPENILIEENLAKKWVLSSEDRQAAPDYSDYDGENIRGSRVEYPTTLVLTGGISTRH